MPSRRGLCGHATSHVPVIVEQRGVIVKSAALGFGALKFAIGFAFG